jgi:hypothetical protein
MTRKTLSSLLLWVFVTGFGLASGQGIGLWLEDGDSYFPIFFLVGVVISGVLIGFGQWVLLHADYKLSWLWIPATAFGIAVGLPMGILVSDFLVSLVLKESDWSYFVVTALIIGTITGTFQWLFTGGKLVSAKWIIVSAVSFLGLAFFYPSFDNPIYAFDSEGWAWSILLFGSLFGMFAGTISGVFILSKLSTQHIRERFLNWRSISLLTVIVTASLISKLFLYDNSYEDPFLFSRYSTYGFYEIYPETILDSLNRGETNVFTPASEEIWNREEPYYDSIQWSQADYLRIANALSQEVWHEPLDLKEWKVLSLSLDQDCVDNRQGFYDFSIVYFQNAGVSFWNRSYHARIIEFYPWQGIIRWGDSTFSDAILPGWGQVDINDFKLTADDAVLIAEENGGSKARQEVDNVCGISVWLNGYSPINADTNNSWLINYRSAGFSVRIDPFSGILQKNEE